jgi:hypothetical protein
VTTLAVVPHLENVTQPLVLKELAILTIPVPSIPMELTHALLSPVRLMTCALTHTTVTLQTKNAQPVKEDNVMLDTSVMSPLVPTLRECAKQLQHVLKHRILAPPSRHAISLLTQDVLTPLALLVEPSAHRLQITALNLLLREMLKFARCAT